MRLYQIVQCESDYRGGQKCGRQIYQKFNPRFLPKSPSAWFTYFANRDCDLASIAPNWITMIGVAASSSNTFNRRREFLRACAAAGGGVEFKKAFARIRCLSTKPQDIPSFLASPSTERVVADVALPLEFRNWGGAERFALEPISITCSWACANAAKEKQENAKLNCIRGVVGVRRFSRTRAVFIGPSRQIELAFRGIESYGRQLMGLTHNMSGYKACGLSLCVGKGEHYFLDAVVFDALCQKRTLFRFLADFFKGESFPPTRGICLAAHSRRRVAARSTRKWRFRRGAISHIWQTLRSSEKTAAYWA